MSRPHATPAFARNRGGARLASLAGVKHPGRVGLATSTVGLLAIVAALAWPVNAPAGGARRDAVCAARERLDLAVAARADARRDMQFDAIVGSLAAGLGTDTPEELSDAIELIRQGRDRERAQQTASSRRLTAAEARVLDRDVARGLALAERTLGRLEVTPEVRPRDATLWVAAGGAAATALGTVLLALALPRRREATRPAARPGRCHSGLEPPARSARPRHATDVGTRVEPDHEEPALFGRVLEIVACDE